MVTIRFATELYASDAISVRNEVDGWNTDVAGSYVDGTWRYEFVGPAYDAGFAFKFYLAAKSAWCDGPNLHVPPASTVVDFDAASVAFGFHVVFDAWDNWDQADPQFALRTSVDGWVSDLRPDGGASPMSSQWTLDWGRYRDGFQAKFVLATDASDASKDVWMLGDNVEILPEPGQWYTFTGEHAGPISFPFFLRLVGNVPAGAVVTVRDQANGWNDRAGWSDGSAWWFALPYTDYRDQSAGGPWAVRYKFVENGRWMTGPNLQIGPDEIYEPGQFVELGRVYDTSSSAVSFG